MIRDVNIIIYKKIFFVYIILFLYIFVKTSSDDNIFNEIIKLDVNTIQNENSFYSFFWEIVYLFWNLEINYFNYNNNNNEIFNNYVKFFYLDEHFDDEWFKRIESIYDNNGNKYNFILDFEKYFKNIILSKRR